MTSLHVLSGSFHDSKLGFCLSHLLAVREILLHEHTYSAKVQRAPML